MNNFGFSTEYAAFSRGDMVELGHNMDHEGTDYYTTLLRQTALDRELQKQHKKHGTMCHTKSVTSDSDGRRASGRSFAAVASQRHSLTAYTLYV